MSTQWWKDLFDQKYLTTYVDIVTSELTNKQVGFLKRVLKKNSRVLDLACGYGRHTIPLAASGYKMTGLDYSSHFLKIARDEASRKKLKVDFVRADMRKFHFDRKFDAVISMFTSFGYFENKSDDLKVLQNIYGALKPHGLFLLDLNNAWRQIEGAFNSGVYDSVSDLISSRSSRRLSNGIELDMRDFVDLLNMRWMMRRSWKEHGTRKKYNVNLRMYLLPELREMLNQAGFEIKKIWGGFSGSKLTVKSSRLIVLAGKK